MRRTLLTIGFWFGVVLTIVLGFCAGVYSVQFKPGPTIVCYGCMFFISAAVGLLLVVMAGLAKH